MMLKSVWTVLLLLGILYQCAANPKTCGVGLTVKECLRILAEPGKRASPEQSFNPRLAPNLDWLGSTEKANEPTCKLKDIYTMIPDDCQAELLQVLHFFVTHSDY
ncbi:uncharacterized protein LOC119729874 [Patiria miniata]|uniref:Uncharacterized protein n=1 Tax=Patiria miniata TaxID=46514 RepID=A0A914A413_PATMI|nr:uncharacterized protein LOC119729874 [Patiria miniata]